MSRFAKLLALLFAIAYPLSDQQTFAQFLQVGGTYNVSGTNFPINFGAPYLTVGGEAVTLDNQVHAVAGGRLNVQAEIFNISAHRQGLILHFNTANGERIASNADARWDMTVSNLPLTSDARGESTFYYWSIDGEPVPNIFNWQGGAVFPPDGTNPLDPAKSPVFGGVANPPFVPGNPMFALFVSPWTFIQSGGGMPANDINGFHVGWIFVPEPSTIALLGLGVVLVGRRLRTTR